MFMILLATFTVLAQLDIHFIIERNIDAVCFVLNVLYALRVLIILFDIKLFF